MKLKPSTSQANPEDIIQGNDPVAVNLLREIYAHLKSRQESNQNLTAIETFWILGIEAEYESNALVDNQIYRFLNQAHQILNQNQTWSAQQDRLYEILEKFVFLQADSSKFQDFFDRFAEVVGAAAQLDFSTKLDLVTDLKDNRNLFNHIATSFNVILEKLETSVTSNKVLDTVLTKFCEQVPLMVTDNEGRIRFSNKRLQSELHLEDRDELLGRYVQEFLVPFPARELSELKEGELIRINLSTPHGPVEYFLSVDRVIAELDDEIEEYVFSLFTTEDVLGNNFLLFRASSEMMPQLKALKNQITKRKEGVTTPEEVSFISKIGHQTELLEEHLKRLGQGAVHSKKGVSREKIDFDLIFMKVVDSLEGANGFDKTNFNLKLDEGIEFYSSYYELYAIINNFLIDGMSHCYSKRLKDWTAHVEVKKEERGVYLILKNAKKKVNTDFRRLTERDLVERDDLRHLYFILQSVQNLRGVLDYISVDAEVYMKIYLPSGK